MTASSERNGAVIKFSEVNRLTFFSVSEVAQPLPRSDSSLKSMTCPGKNGNGWNYLPSQLSKNLNCLSAHLWKGRSISASRPRRSPTSTITFSTPSTSTGGWARRSEAAPRASARTEAWSRPAPAPKPTRPELHRVGAVAYPAPVARRMAPTMSSVSPATNRHRKLRSSPVGALKAGRIKSAARRMIMP